MAELGLNSSKKQVNANKIKLNLMKIDSIEFTPCISRKIILFLEFLLYEILRKIW